MNEFGIIIMGFLIGLSIGTMIFFETHKQTKTVPTIIPIKKTDAPDSLLKRFNNLYLIEETQHNNIHCVYYGPEKPGRDTKKIAAFLVGVCYPQKDVPAA